MYNFKTWGSSDPGDFICHLPCIKKNGQYTHHNLPSLSWGMIYRAFSLKKLLPIMNYNRIDTHWKTPTIPSLWSEPRSEVTPANQITQMRLYPFDLKYMYDINNSLCLQSLFRNTKVDRIFLVCHLINSNSSTKNNYMGQMPITHTYLIRDVSDNSQFIFWQHSEQFI